MLIARYRGGALTLWLTVAAILYRALIPDGYMPERSSDGDIVIGICPAGPMAALAGDPHAHPGHHGKTSCPFAAAAAPSVLPAWTVSIAANEEVIVAASPNIATVALAPVRLRPPTRAPPVT